MNETEEDGRIRENTCHSEKAFSNEVLATLNVRQAKKYEGKGIMRGLDRRKVSSGTLQAYLGLITEHMSIGIIFDSRSTSVSKRLKRD